MPPDFTNNWLFLCDLESTIVSQRYWWISCSLLFPWRHWTWPPTPSLSSKLDLSPRCRWNICKTLNMKYPYNLTCFNPFFLASFPLDSILSPHLLYLSHLWSPFNIEDNFPPTLYKTHMCIVVWYLTSSTFPFLYQSHKKNPRSCISCRTTCVIKML